VSLSHRRLRNASLIALAGAVLGTGMALAQQAPGVDLRTTAPTRGDAAAGAAKATVCAACHGADGYSVVPQFPNLAGQSATYLYVQLRAFKDGWRTNAVMQGQVAKLDDGDLRDLAAHYAALAPHAPHASAAASRGGRLFHDGDGALGIPACQGCHGPDGRGPRTDPASTAPQPAWATFPALAGQNPDYLVAQLKAFHDGTRKGSSNNAIMHGVTAHLGEQDMQALAAYISAM
jgi:cytochrome c553